MFAKGRLKAVLFVLNNTANKLLLALLVIISVGLIFLFVWYSRFLGRTLAIAFFYGSVGEVLNTVAFDILLRMFFFSENI